jgi:predicted membrane protein
MLIFTSRGMHIDDETLQNFISEHTIDLKNVQRN